MKNFYNLSKQELFTKCDSSNSGLSNKDAETKLNINGKNVLPEAKKTNIFKKFFSQFKDVLILILIISSIISILIGEYIDAIIIIVVVLINSIIGVVQENKAEEAMQGLKNLTKPYSKVLRDGETQKILSENLVVGDLVILEAGDFVPADLRIIESNSLKTIESSLTGESTDCEKVAYELSDQDIVINDQKNMAFMGTTVSYGRGMGIVVKTGKDTEMGKIATSIATTKYEKTLLEKKVDKTSKILSIIIICISIIIFAVGLIRDINNYIECFMIAISIAVCAVPEGLPTGITITMSLGVANMSKKKAIVKKLNIVEALGATQIICSDKTGTLTLNQMTVKETFVFSENKDKTKNPDFLQLINAMLLNNDTKLVGKDTMSYIGDPTEIALSNYAQTFNFNKENFDGKYPRVNEIPFDSDRKLMTTINIVDGKNVVYTKGALDNLILKCDYILCNGVEKKITDDDKNLILQKAQEYGENALRVLCFATKNYNGNLYDLDKENVESGLTLIGIVGMIDPPRSEVKPAIETCKKAGIKVIMITGDHKDTAFAIAKEIGIANNKNEVMEGSQIDKLSSKQLANKLETISVFARVSPEHKLKIVSALQSHNYVVAMTGDGVNDSPSIKKANVGIGMGITGTDVTKEVADIILTDDNFTTIVSAVKEGRRIYENILKIIIFLLSTCLAEIVLMFTVITILGLDLFSAPVILFINIISDTFPALALGAEKAEKDIMERKPNNNNKSLFSGLNGLNILFIGLIQGIILLVTFIICYYVLNLNNQVISSVCFISLVFLELFHSYNLRDMHNSLFISNPFSNKFLNYAFIISAVFTIGFILILPASLLSSIGLAKLSIKQILISIAISLLIIPIYELFKLCVRKYNKKSK